MGRARREARVKAFSPSRPQGSCTESLRDACAALDALKAVSRKTYTVFYPKTGRQKSLMVQIPIYESWVKLPFCCFPNYFSLTFLICQIAVIIASFHLVIVRNK